MTPEIYMSIAAVIAAVAPWIRDAIHAVAEFFNH